MPQDLDAHMKETPCTPTDFCYEGITPDQATLLRNSNTGTSRNEVDRWQTMWRILFPHVPLPASPYAQRSVAAKQTAVAARKFLDAKSTWEMMLEIFPNIAGTPESARAEHRGNVEHLLSCFLDFMDDQHEEVQESHKRVSQPAAKPALEDPGARRIDVSWQSFFETLHPNVSDSNFLPDVQGIGHSSQDLHSYPALEHSHWAADSLKDLLDSETLLLTDMEDLSSGFSTLDQGKLSVERT